MLTSGSVLLYDFDALNLPLAGTGAKCIEGSECTSGACCSGPGNMFQSLCSSDPQCTQGDTCSVDANCKGKCVLSAATGPTGFCATSCAASGDCPKETFCIEGACLPVCSLAQDCPYQGVNCARVANTEGVDVSVCRPR
jgi:hypothetical protein